MILGGGIAAQLTKETEITGGEKIAQMRTGVMRRGSLAQSMLDKGSQEIVPLTRDTMQEEQIGEIHHHLTHVEDHVTEKQEEGRHHQEEK